ncbi:MAG: THxN family PEP-CTERM protein [Gammaproteobacteria bacterium]|nr:THxN family PEP-CTERM protein [Gammaproteobacteria bacterium]
MSALSWALACLFFAAGANAAVVGRWDVDVNAAFVGADTLNADAYKSPTLLEWSDGDEGPSRLRVPENMDSNPVRVQGLRTVGPNGVSFGQTGTVSNLFTLTHDNNPIRSPDFSATTLAMTVNLTANDGSGAGTSLSLEMPIVFNETANLQNFIENDTRTCAGDTPRPCRDIFVAGAETIDRLFTVDAVEYFVSIFPTDQQAISRLLDEECVASGAGVGCVGFTTEEGQSTSVQIGITISTDRINQVPVPPAFALLSGALVVLAGVRRRSRG